jgi:peptide/nickel transport system substrate-binding protein
MACLTRRSLFRIAGVGLLVFILMSVASAGASARSTASPSGVLVVNDSVGPATLDEASDACGFEDQWGTNFYRQLFRIGTKPGPYSGVTVQDPRTVLGDVATSWSESSNGLTYTIHLNPDAKFLDGTPINAAAVMFSMQRAQTLGSCGAAFWDAENFTDAPTMTTPNATTVVVHLKQPNGLLLDAWAVPGPTAIYEPSLVTQHPDTKGQSVNPYWANHIAGGGGPYVLESYVPDEKMIMKANPAYTGPTPAMQAEVVANFGLSESTLVLDARNGSADVTFGLTPDDLVGLQSDKSVRVLKLPVQQFYSLGLNNTIPPFNNEKLREALAYAVPYQSILTDVLRGFGAEYYGPIAQTLPDFNPAIAPQLTFNLAKAKSLLAASGVKLPLNVTMVLQQGATVPAQMATIVQADWAKLNVHVSFDTLGVTAYDTTVEGRKDESFIRIDGPGAATAGWLLGYDMICGGSFNLSDICIPPADKLLTQAENTTNAALAQTDYNKITALWRAEFPKILLANIDQGIVLNNAVKKYDWSVIATEEVHAITVT